MKAIYEIPAIEEIKVQVEANVMTSCETVAVSPDVECEGVYEL